MSDFTLNSKKCVTNYSRKKRSPEDCLPRFLKNRSPGYRLGDILPTENLKFQNELGKEVNLADYIGQGDVIVLNTCFAIDCVPCNTASMAIKGTLGDVMGETRTMLDLITNDYGVDSKIATPRLQPFNAFDGTGMTPCEYQTALAAPFLGETIDLCPLGANHYKPFSLPSGTEIIPVVVRDFDTSGQIPSDIDSAKMRDVYLLGKSRGLILHDDGKVGAGTLIELTRDLIGVRNVPAFVILDGEGRITGITIEYEIDETKSFDPEDNEATALIKLIATNDCKACTQDLIDFDRKTINEVFTLDLPDEFPPPGIIPDPVLLAKLNDLLDQAETFLCQGKHKCVAVVLEQFLKCLQAKYNEGDLPNYQVINPVSYVWYYTLTEVKKLNCKKSDVVCEEPKRDEKCGKNKVCCKCRKSRCKK